MRAAYVVEHGPPEQVVVQELPDPVPGPGEVLVDIAYAAVNFPDVLVVNNEYQVQVSAPFVPGSEFAGVIGAVGDGVEAVAVGTTSTAAASSVRTRRRSSSTPPVSP
jgi:NADPH2:quinone reductase